MSNLLQMQDLRKHLVSIIIPTCDRPRLLERAIRSVIKQNYLNFEIIVIDDSIKKPVDNVIKHLENDKIKYIKHAKRHRGPAGVRNVGIQAARGDFVSFLDDDDEYLPNFLDTLVTILRNSANAQMAIGKVMVHDGKGNNKLEAKIPKKEGFLRDLIPLPCYIFPNSFMLRRECIEFFDTLFPYYEDVDYVLRLAEKGIRYIYSDVPVAIRHDDSQINRVTDLTKRDIVIGELLIRKHKEILSENPFYYSDIIFNHVCKIYHYESGQRIIRFLRDALIASPFHLKHLFVFIFVFFLRTVKIVINKLLISNR